jgi:hypothetical protein
MANQLDPLGLITPVINSLATLGTGQFAVADPTQALSAISNAYDGNATPLQQATGSAANGWQGQSGAAANTQTQAALDSGADVANQANGLGNNLSTATDASHRRGSRLSTSSTSIRQRWPLSADAEALRSEFHGFNIFVGNFDATESRNGADKFDYDRHEWYSQNHQFNNGRSWQ